MNKNLRSLTLLLTFVLFSFTTEVFAQNTGVNYNLSFQKEQRWVPENFKDFLKKDKVQDDEIIQGKYFRIVQFFELPTDAEKASMERMGMEFLNYIPSRAYIVAIPKGINKANLKNKSIRAVIPIERDLKMDKSLVNIDWNHVSVDGDNIEVLLRVYGNISMDWAARQIQSEKADLITVMEESKVMQVRIAIADLEDFAELPFVSFLAIMPEPGEPEDRRGASLHRANMINTEYASGRHYDGSGVGVLVRDDGFVGPHIDFKGREFQNTNGDSPGHHADGVAGILAGAGNLNPDMKGMAAGSDMHVIEYFTDFNANLISLDLHQNEGVLVVNSSYSNGCNAGYTTITETVDRHVFENPTFLHVFSAGNSNNNDCDYGAGDQWGNITGGHKQGKNVIATANVFEDASLAGSSSRGPAHDGRIKPDITANGQGQNSTDPFNNYSPFGGTSAASPGVAGVSAQLHHVYQDLNNGDVAPSALIKAALINTANDMGNVGPDFKFGWGHMNAYRAYKLLKDNRFESDIISHNGNNTHTINIPSGAVQVRFMVYWNERAGFPGTGKALVNDLDMIVTDPNGGTKLPWVLDETPNAATLDLPATNGEDHLNNVEQVLFDDPIAGEYTIDVNGFEVAFGPQEYFILYEVITEEITVTYPIGGEGFVPNQAERLRWDAFGDDGQFEVEYTTDDGATWQSLVTLPGTERMYLWNNVANVTSGQVRVRVSRNGFSDESDANFSIVRRPVNLSTEQFCPNYMRVSWSPVTGATGYDIFYLGEKFMDSVGTSTTTEFDIPLPSPFGEHWFSVRARGDNGLKGKRANAVMYDDGLFNCTLENDVATTQLFSPSSTSIVGCNPVQDVISIEVENTSINDQSILSFGYQFGNLPVVEEPYNGTLAVGEKIQHTFATPVDFNTSGVYLLKTWSTIPNDDVFFNDTIVRTIVVSLGDLAVPNPDFMEDFGGDQFPPEDWFESNPDGDFGWEQIAGIPGADGDNTRAAIVRNRNYDDIGERDELFSVPLDFTNVANPIITFDLAYARFTTTCSDTLIIEAYTECGDVYAGEVYKKFGNDLATDGLSPSDWLPNGGSDWRKDFAELSAFTGEEVLLKFINVNGNCNNLLIDNVNISNYAAPDADFTSSVTEVCLGQEVSFTNNSTAVLATHSWKFGQGASFPISFDVNPSPVFYITPGEKEVRLIVSNPLGADTIIHIVNVLDDPEVDYSYDQVGQGYQFNNESDYVTGFLWDFGDNTSSTDENPFKVYNFPGTYTVKLTGSNICSEDFAIQNIDITVTDVKDLDERVQIQIIPNPNDGVFQLKIEDVTIRDLDIQIFDVQGRQIGKWNTQSGVGAKFFPIEKSTWAAGLYYVKIQSEEAVRTLKMTVL